MCDAPEDRPERILTPEALRDLAGYAGMSAYSEMKDREDLGEPLDPVDISQNREAYAQGVADTLRWLAGDEPSHRLLIALQFRTPLDPEDDPEDS